MRLPKFVEWPSFGDRKVLLPSAIYRQDSKPDSAGLARDPDNVFVWRWAPRRAEAEVVRDCLFAISGSLNSTMGGPDIDHQASLTVPRRTRYFRHAAEKQMEFLQIFDAAGVTECYRRKESILPQQALALANSDLSLRIAPRLARTRSIKSGADSSVFVTATYYHVLARRPTETERAECLGFLGQGTTWANRPSRSL
jgi:hypothetical protein